MAEYFGYASREITEIEGTFRSSFRSLKKALRKAIDGLAGKTMPERLDGIKMYYAGAALCVALLDSSGETAGFFDVGLKCGGSSIPIARRKTAEKSKRGIYLFPNNNCKKSCFSFRIRITLTVSPSTL